MNPRTLLCSLLVGLALFGCGDASTSPGPDAEVAPTDVPSDGQPALPSDAGAPVEVDAPGPPDDIAVVPDVPVGPSETETAWGTITGACGLLAAAAQEDEAALLLTTYTFTDATFDTAGLSGKSLQRYEEPNAGGSSKCSEVMSMQLLIDCEGATVTKTETEVVYDTEGKLADYLALLGGVSAGVSVTRAYLGPVGDTYTLADATELLDKKLTGITEALGHVSAADAWERSVVHIWTLHPEWADTVAAAWEALDPVVKGDTLVLVTVEVGSEAIVTDSCDD